MRDPVSVGVWRFDAAEPRVRELVATTVGLCPREREAFAVEVRGDGPEVGARLDELVAALGPALHEVSFEWTRPGALGALVRASGLRRLVVRRAFETRDAEFEALAALPRLEALTLDYVDEVRGAFVRAFAGAPLRALTIRGAKWMTSKQLAGIERLAALEALHLGDAPRLTDDVFARVAALPRLERLWVTGCKKVSGAGLAALAACPALRSVNFWASWSVGADSVRALAEARGLDFARAGDAFVRPVGAGIRSANGEGVVALCGPQVDDEALRAASVETDLCMVAVADAPAVTDAGLAHLARLSWPTSLALERLPGVSPGGVRRLLDAHRGTLRWVRLGDDVATDDGVLAALGEQRALESASLARLERATDRGVARLATCARLTSLTACGLRRATSAGVAALAGLKGLDVLSLCDLPAFDDEALARLVAGMRALRVLVLSDAPALRLGPAVFAAGAPRLDWLHVRRCASATPEWLAARDALPALRSVKVHACEGVDDAWLDALADAPTLTDVGVWGCPRVTTAGVERLVRRGSMRRLDLGELPGVDRAAIAQAVAAVRPASARPHVSWQEHEPAF